MATPSSLDYKKIKKIHLPRNPAWFYIFPLHPTPQSFLQLAQHYMHSDKSLHLKNAAKKIFKKKILIIIRIELKWSKCYFFFFLNPMLRFTFLQLLLPTLRRASTIKRNKWRRTPPPPPTSQVRHQRNAQEGPRRPPLSMASSAFFFFFFWIFDFRGSHPPPVRPQVDQRQLASHTRH